MCFIAGVIMSCKGKIVVRYSEAFKMQLIQELESGKLDSIEHARRSYGIAGTTTIQKWLKKYGRNDLRAKVVRVEKPNEQDQIKRLVKEVKALKSALAETQVQNLLNRSVYEVLCNEVGVDPSEFKKKANMPQSVKRPRRPRKKNK